MGLRLFGTRGHGLCRESLALYTCGVPCYDLQIQLLEIKFTFLRKYSCCLYAELDLCSLHAPNSWPIRCYSTSKVIIVQHLMKRLCSALTSVLLLDLVAKLLCPFQRLGLQRLIDRFCQLLRC